MSASAMQGGHNDLHKISNIHT